MIKNRLETFSDSVIAIVITLLSFELKTPIQNSLDNYETYAALLKMLPQFFVFVISFLTISIMWINHHYITNKIVTMNHRTVWANSLLLLFLSLIPFITSFLASNPYNKVALIVYSLVMLFASLSFSYLKHFSLPVGEATHGRERFHHVGVYAYSLAIFVTFFTPQFTYLVLLVPPLSYILPAKN